MKRFVYEYIYKLFLLKLAHRYAEVSVVIQIKVGYQRVMSSGRMWLYAHSSFHYQKETYPNLDDLFPFISTCFDKDILHITNLR